MVVSLAVHMVVSLAAYMNVNLTVHLVVILTVHMVVSLAVLLVVPIVQHLEPKRHPLQHMWVEQEAPLGVLLVKVELVGVQLSAQLAVVVP
jgi:hypothetical protein